MPKLTSAKTGLIAAATALTATLASPAIASADVVDDVLAKMPSGQISCSQAKSQYTNASDYNSKKRQALAVAAIHQRGGEIREAIGRMDEAIARCNLNGGGNTGGNTGGNKNSGNQNNNSGKTNTGNKNSGTKNSGTKNTGAQVIPVLVQPGMPTVDVPVANIATFRIPDAAKIASNTFKEVSANIPGSSF
ncbi:hypothetical protein AYJ05_09305 [Corynebacterium stationis]|uniref:Secreted protein n=1 Tax=Corynebacterium stationis TaxID=1705 RepID=A0A177IMF2_9CORY|nr:hypothetical protein [Corynebacterium stationis]OAH30008.1 hypothetical protein AYJ05_09305 [Corynebacterium stationis]